MIVIAGLIAGGVLGYRRAARRGGNGFDKSQYAAAHAILFGLAGLFATIIIDRLF
jgi:hypothetical protein